MDLYDAFELGDALLERYEVLGKERGGFGVVVFVRDQRNGEQLAVKIPRVRSCHDGSGVETFAQEVKFWLALYPHPNVVKAHFLREVLGLPALFMDYVEGGNLRDRLHSGPLHENAAICAAYQLAIAMEFVNRNGEVAHLDLKPENLLFKGDVLKVTDFGLAHRVRVERGAYIRRDVATWQYAAPEIFEGGVGNTQSDIYSFGLILYEMLCGHLPYPFQLSPEELDEAFEALARFHRQAGMDTITKSLYYSGIPGYTEKELGTFVSACLQSQAARRPRDFKEVLGMLESRWPFKRPQDTERDLTANQLFEHAIALRKMGQLSDALIKFNELLVREQHTAIYWREAAQALESSGDFEAARVFEERAALLDKRAN